VFVPLLGSTSCVLVGPLRAGFCSRDWSEAVVDTHSVAEEASLWRLGIGLNLVVVLELGFWFERQAELTPPVRVENGLRSLRRDWDELRRPVAVLSLLSLLLAVKLEVNRLKQVLR